MAQSELPVDEAERLRAVRRYDILDTPPDGSFDRITALAARFCRVPISTITIVDEDRIWFKSTHGVDVDEISRDPGLCASAIIRDAPHIVTNAIEDPRTLDNPLVRGELGLRFYVGIPLRTEDGYRLGTLNVIDVAPREVSQEEVETLEDLAAVVVDELELRLAARRTIEVKAAREAAEFRESLLAAISHQMRTPIALLASVVGLDHSDALDEEGVRQMMQRQVRRLDRLINQYLDFTRIEAGHDVDVTLSTIDPAEVVEAARSAFSPDDTAIEVDVEEALPMVRVDERRTRQILLELLSNALQFGPRDEPVRVRVRADGEGVAIDVTDRGPGLHADDQGRVFEKLYRGKQSGGTGIGLYVARALAEAQGASISVESTLGEGSRFTLHLPAAD